MADNAAAGVVAVVGGGPAGLMAAEVLAARGVAVDLFDAMPSVGRKFLLAGRGGLNLTHSEPQSAFIGRFAERASTLAPLLAAFGPKQVREWAADLGIETFVGTSGRVFPTGMKAAPLLRAWLHRLRASGVKLHARCRWQGWTAQGDLVFNTPLGTTQHQAKATILALGGASWARLGSDGQWARLLQNMGAEVTALQAANCGFNVAPTGPDRSGWSPHLREKFAGQPIKPVAIHYTDAAGQTHHRQGEFVLTDTGIEGSLVYAFSAKLRDRIAADGHALIHLDLLPAHSPEQVLAETSHARGPRSLSTHLKSRLGIQGLKMALLHECLAPAQLSDAAQLAQALKALPLRLLSARPIDEAISTAGGVRFESLNESLMLNRAPGVFCAGEMLDWEAPTGGYLLTACMATGFAAGHGAANWLAAQSP